jgi:hypothetical protein
MHGPCTAKVATDLFEYATLRIRESETMSRNEAGDERVSPASIEVFGRERVCTTDRVGQLVALSKGEQQLNAKKLIEDQASTCRSSVIKFTWHVNVVKGHGAFHQLQTRPCLFVEWIDEVSRAP